MLLQRTGSFFKHVAGVEPDFGPWVVRVGVVLVIGAGMEESDEAQRHLKALEAGVDQML